MYSYRLPSPKYEGTLRRCLSCGLQDAPLFSGEYTDKHEPIFEHKVVLDVYYLRQRRVLTRQEIEQKFEFVMLGDQPAKIRTLCRPCLEEVEATHRVWLDFEKQKAEDQSENDDSTFWNVLCS